MVAGQSRGVFREDKDVHETAATITAALLSRMPLPSDRDEAADYAVGLFWRIERGLLSEEPEQARPERPDFEVRQKEQP